MVSSILLLCTDPDGFFRRDPKDWSGLKIPAAIVFAAGIIGAIAAYPVSQTMLKILPENLQAASGLVGVIGTVGAIAGTFIAWVAYTAVFFILSMIFMGKGTFTRTLAAMGYGFIPAAIGNFLNLILYWYYLPGIQVTPVKDVMDIQSATATLTHSPVFQITGIIGIIFLVWSASIWIFGLRSSRGLTLRNAAISVGIPVLVFIAITLVFMGVFS